jgi:peptidoglycan/LPS O-acetylase OafA/YrhL
MLGTLRFVLAVLVVMNHLWLPTANKLGAHAVLGFYVISGFLMTRILSEVYVGPGGRIRYFANRFLRIFPGYWFVAVLTLAGLAMFPGHFGNFHGAIRIPQTGYEWLQNLTLIDLIYAPLRLVPPAWSLSVELVFYILIGAGISRTSRGAWAWWLASAAYTVYLVASGAPFGERYTPPAAASLFFSTGAVVYHYAKSRRVPPPGALRWWLLLTAFCVGPIVIEALGWDRRMIGFYGAYALFLPLFAWSVRGGASSDSRKSLDRFLGDLAYPVFLSHFAAAGLANLISGNRLSYQGSAHFLLSLVLCLTISAVMARYLDSTVNRLRDRIRPAK